MSDTPRMTDPFAELNAHLDARLDELDREEAEIDAMPRAKITDPVLAATEAEWHAMYQKLGPEARRAEAERVIAEWEREDAERVAATIAWNSTFGANRQPDPPASQSGG